MIYYLIRLVLRLVFVTVLALYFITGLCIIIPMLLYILGFDNIIDRNIEFFENINYYINNLKR